jgi:hypothetical protein
MAKSNNLNVSPGGGGGGRFGGILGKTKTPKVKGNELNETSPVVSTPRQEVFKGTISDIKATPKLDKSVPDSRLESLNNQTFF